MGIIAPTPTKIGVSLRHVNSDLEEKSLPEPLVTVTDPCHIQGAGNDAHRRTEMTYKSCTENHLLFPLYADHAKVEDLRSLLLHGYELNYGSFTPGFGTIIAHLRRPSDDLVIFEAADLSEHRLHGPFDANRVLAHWLGYCENARKAHELSRFQRRREEIRRAEAETTVDPDAILAAGERSADEAFYHDK